MLFGRKKNLFPDTDLFPMTDTFVETGEEAVPVPIVHRRRHDPPQQLPPRSKAQKWLIACTLLTLYLVTVAAFQAFGMVQKNTVILLLAMQCGGALVFFALFKNRINLKFREKRLKLPIVASALAGMLFLCYRDPATEIIFTPFAFVTIAYGMYRISRATAMGLVAIVLVAFAGITTLHYWQTLNIDLLKIELMHLFALMTSLPAFVFLIGKVEQLHRVLHRAGRKIKNIQEDAQRDTLIGCYNRRYMVAALEQHKHLADDNNIPMCLAVIDLDHFKKINDELGHLGGDRVLKQFSIIALDCVRGEDVFGRYGGEEFLLIFPNTTLLPALNTSERIRSQVEHYAWNTIVKCRVSVSIGVTQYIPGETVLELFSRADTAMYLAKEGGRNQVVVEEPVPGRV